MSGTNWYDICRIHGTVLLIVRSMVRIRFLSRRIEPIFGMDKNWQQDVFQELSCWEVHRVLLLLGTKEFEDWRLPEFFLELCSPGETIADFKDALNTLHGALSYLYNNPNGNRFWYDTKPTLRKTAEDRASQISEADVEIEIESRLKKIRKEMPFAGVHACPTSSNDVPDEQAVRLVILRTKDTYRRNSSNSNAMKTVEDILNNRGASPRIFRNMLAFVAPDMNKLGSLQQEVRRFMAWTSIMSDKDDLNLDGGQIRETHNNLTRSNDTVAMRFKRDILLAVGPVY